MKPHIHSLFPYILLSYQIDSPKATNAPIIPPTTDMEAGVCLIYARVDLLTRGMKVILRVEVIVTSVSSTSVFAELQVVTLAV
jgi:hypothetical protein